MTWSSSPARATGRCGARPATEQTAILAHTLSADGRRWIALARDELARYEKLTGVPYPYPTFRVAESAAGLPMEAPGLIWIPGSRRAADHPFLISHETAHQWWYGIVGNDQSTDAFADEAMADYFSRKAHLSIRGSRCRRDRLDRDIRDYSSACYFEVDLHPGRRLPRGAAPRLRRSQLQARRADVHAGQPLRAGQQRPAAGGLPGRDGRRGAAALPRPLPEPVLRFAEPLSRAGPCPG